MAAGLSGLSGILVRQGIACKENNQEQELVTTLHLKMVERNVLELGRSLALALRKTALVSSFFIIDYDYMVGYI